MQIFITGGTGFIGRSLCEALLHEGHVVKVLSRSEAPRGLPPEVQLIRGDPTVAGRWQEELGSCEACVNLAGEAVAAGRWNDRRRTAIRDSRVRATENVVEVVSERGPTVLVNGSAVGYYGPCGDEELEELGPAVKSAVAKGIDATGPFPADSVFLSFESGKCDAVLSLYHDQGHIAAKVHDFLKTIAITIGLPFVRTAVDHGTAMDIAGKGLASAVSMEESIPLRPQAQEHPALRRRAGAPAPERRRGRATGARPGSEGDRERRIRARVVVGGARVAASDPCGV